MTPSTPLHARSGSAGLPVRQAGLVQGLVLSLATFLPIMATISIAPAVPRLIQHFQGVPNADVLVPMLMSIPAICIAIASPVSGFLADRMGRRRVLIAAVIIYGIFGMAPLLLDNLYAILATRVGVGVAEAMLYTVGKTLIGDYFSGARRQQWVGYQNALDAGLGSATWLSGGLLAAVSWRAPFFLYLLSIPLLLAVLLFIWEPHRTAGSESGDEVESEESEPFPWKRMSVVYGVTLFCAAIYFSYPVNIAKALTELGVADASRIGVLTAIASLGTPLGALLYSRATFVRAPLMIALALLFIGGPYVGIGLAAHFQQATAFGFVEQLGNGLMGAVLTTWCLSCLPFEHRGRGMGVWGTFLVSGIFISPLLFAFMERVSGSVLTGFVYMGGICVAAIAVVPFLLRLTETHAQLDRNPATGSA